MAKNDRKVKAIIALRFCQFWAVFQQYKWAKNRGHIKASVALYYFWLSFSRDKLFGYFLAN
jgi:hypothetical protein